MLLRTMTGARMAPDDRTEAALRRIERGAAATKRERLLADVGLDGRDAAVAGALSDTLGLAERSLALDGLH